MKNFDLSYKEFDEFCKKILKLSDPQFEKVVSQTRQVLTQQCDLLNETLNHQVERHPL